MHPHLAVPHHAQKLQQRLLVCRGHRPLGALAFPSILRLGSLDVSCSTDSLSRHRALNRCTPMPIPPTRPEPHAQVTPTLWRGMSATTPMVAMGAIPCQHVRTCRLLAAYGLMQCQQELGVHDGVHTGSVGWVRVQQGEHKGCFLGPRLQAHTRLEYRSAAFDSHSQRVANRWGPNGTSAEQGGQVARTDTP